MVKWREKKDSGELLYTRAVCSDPLLPQQWAESANTLTLAHTGLVQLWLCRRGLSARPSLLWLSNGHGFFTPRSWEDAPSRAEIIPFPLGRHCVVSKPLWGNWQLCRKSKGWSKKSGLPYVSDHSITVQTQNLKIVSFLTTRVSFWIEVRRVIGDIKRWSVQPWQHGASRPPKESWRCTV